jgi:hypothetical protein
MVVAGRSSTSSVIGPVILLTGSISAVMPQPAQGTSIDRTTLVAVDKKIMGSFVGCLVPDLRLSGRRQEDVAAAPASRAVSPHVPLTEVSPELAARWMTNPNPNFIPVVVRHGEDSSLGQADDQREQTGLTPLKKPDTW